VPDDALESLKDNGPHL